MLNLISLVLIFFLSACNLKPVYKENTSKVIYKEIGAIDVEPLSLINGSEFYYQLNNILPKISEAKYLLRAQFTAAIIPATIEKNSNVLREAINQTVQYQLVDIKTGKVLISEKFHQNTSYNAIFAPYAANIEKEKSEIELAYQAANEIYKRLILYFTIKDNVL